MRAGASAPELPEIERLLDLYWSGPERRISPLTVRIIGMNALAMLLLAVGIVSLSEYQEKLIDAKLQTFNTELQLVSRSIAEIALENGKLNEQKAERIVRRMIETAIPQRIRVFDKDGAVVVDSDAMEDVRRSAIFPTENNRLYSVEILKNMARSVIELLPGKRTLPIYPPMVPNSINPLVPDIDQALNGAFSLSAWDDMNDHVFLSGAAPLEREGVKNGAILLTRSARDINEAIGDMWLNIVAAFISTLILTILISIYLSGVISSPLRRLAKAAEGVRKGKLTMEDIPDFSARKDEIGELSLAFRDMMNALWDRMDSTERFAADVAHELKNPLTSLKSAVETMSIAKKKKDQERLIGIIQHDINRLDRLITDISQASRLDSELSRDVYARVNVKNVLYGLMEAYADPLIRKDRSQQNSAITDVTFKGVRVRLALELQGDAHIWGLESRLEQVFQNILANALSFSKQGQNILIRLHGDVETVRVSIEDEGPGIPEKNLKAIFERFYTERPAHEAYGKHSGLGLSICKQIVTAMGGDLYAENIKNRAGSVSGARFVVVLKRI